MIRLTGNIWIGDSASSPLKMDAVLNVAQDMRGDCGWPDVEYMQVGLVDGPGNPPSAYCAAVLALAALCRRHRRVLVCCHTGSRSVAVVLMYVSILTDRSWDDSLVLLRERADGDIPDAHDAHKRVFDRIDWKTVTGIMETA